MQEIQLYIKDTSNVYQRVDLFSGDSLSITDSIKNAKDISKVFTTFSKQFSLPASKTNNLLFKHYYNYHIENGFDGRKKIDAKIELNHLAFRKGKIKLDGVDMRMNKPYAYRVTFYGSVVELKDVLGEDKLPSLSSLDIDKQYSGSAIKTALTSATASDGTVIPLITHSQRLYYNSALESEQSGNLYYGSLNQGVKFDQLKYAVKLSKIITAIEDEYTEIEFATDSFFKDATKDFGELYMWCHRKKGGVDLSSDPVYNIIDGFNYSDSLSNTVLALSSTDDHIIIVDEGTTQMTNLYFEASTTSTNGAYDIIIYKNSGSGFEIFQEQREIFGTKTVQIIDTFVDGNQYYAAVRTYEEPITFSGFEWSATYSGGSDSLTETSRTFAQSYSFNIGENMPEMKIIDFLSNLFKMFNLVAYVQDNGIIQVKTLDEFYSTDIIDISEYVSVEESQVDSALPYREIFFKYKDTSSLLAEKHFKEVTNEYVEWGGVEYSDTINLSGDIYKMEPDFHHAKYEKLFDAANGLSDTGVQVGYFVTDNEEALLGKPLIFYVNKLSAQVDIGFLERNSRSSITTSSQINMPSNLRDIDDNTSNNIHFGVEKSEYSADPDLAEGALDAEETLFKRFYQTYIENIFDSGARIIKVKAILPVRILIDIELSDIIAINGNKYRINSMKMNLKDGKTDFELITI